MIKEDSKIVPMWINIFSVGFLALSSLTRGNRLKEIANMGKTKSMIAMDIATGKISCS